MQVDGAVVPLLKDTHDNEHLPNEDKIIWQQVLWMPLIFPLTKGHPSSEATIIWWKGCPY